MDVRRDGAASANDAGDVRRENTCVRPAFYMNLKETKLWQYAGTICSDGTVTLPGEETALPASSSSTEEPTEEPAEEPTATPTPVITGVDEEAAEQPEYSIAPETTSSDTMNPESSISPSASDVPSTSNPSNTVVPIDTTMPSDTTQPFNTTVPYDTILPSNTTLPSNTILPLASAGQKPFSSSTPRPTATAANTTGKNKVKEATIIGKSSYKKQLHSEAFSLDIETESDGQVTYSSSQEEVAEVSDEGFVTIHGLGSATITVKVAGTASYKSAEKKIKINVGPDKIKGFRVKSVGRGHVKFSWKKQKVKKRNVRFRHLALQALRRQLPCQVPRSKRGNILQPACRVGIITSGFVS